MNRESQRLEEKAAAYLNENGILSARLISHYAFETVRHEIRGPAVLTLGLGDGAVAQSLAYSFKDVVAVEGSEAVIKYNQIDGIKIVHSLFEEYDPRREFNTVIGTYILEHVKDPDFVLKLIGQWLTDDGVAIFTVPNAQSLHRRVGVELGLLERCDSLNELDIAVGHRRVYTMTTLSNRLNQAGFREYRFQGFLLKTVSNAQMAGWSQELLDALYRVSLTLPPQFCSSLAVFCRK